MDYKEKLLFRNRSFELKSNGVQVYDNGLFHSSYRMYKYENIGNQVNYERGSIIIPIVFILLMTSIIYLLSIILTDYSSLIILAYLLIISSYVYIIIRTSGYTGTIYFTDSHRANKNEFFLLSSFPFKNETKAFLEKLRKKRICQSYNTIILHPRNEYSIQQHFLDRLRRIKIEMNLCESEYKDLNAKLNSYFEENNIPEIYVCEN